MGVVESNDKKTLLKKSAQQREALEHEVDLLSEKTEKIITNALIIGGSLALSYFLMRQFLKSDTRKKSKNKSKAYAARVVEPEETEQEPSFISSLAAEVGTTLASSLTAFLLELAKEKLVEYLDSTAKPKPANNEHS